MRPIIIALIITVSAVVSFAQSDNWGPAAWVAGDWQDSCFNLFGFRQPAVFPSDSLMMLTHRCWGQFRLAYSLLSDNAWQNPIDINIIGESPSVLCNQETTIYFSSCDYGGFGGYDILATHFHNGDIDSIWNLGANINSAADENSPSLTRDGQKIFFSRDNTIVYAEKTNGQFGLPVPLPECINSAAYQEFSPRISHDGLKLYFTRSYGILAPSYMFVSYFENGIWQNPLQLNANINFRIDEPQSGEPYAYTSEPSFTADGTKMYFTYYGFPGGEAGAGLAYSELTQSIPSGDANIPFDFTLYAYPNPFNSQTMIIADYPRGELNNVSVYNLAGQLVRQLPAGTKVIWDGRDLNGNSVATGIYFARVNFRDTYKSLKLTLLR
jgi:hypothetical protein